MASAPVRSCVVCRQRAPKAELVRWTVTDGHAVRDDNQSVNARGYYSCQDHVEAAPQRILQRLKRRK